MPLYEGKENWGRNVRELMHAYHTKGRIGNTRPRSNAHAQLIANAIAARKAEGK